MSNPKISNHSRERIKIDVDWRFHPGDFPEFPLVIPVTQWHYKNVGEDKPATDEMASPEFPISDWATIASWEDAFNWKPGYAWFRVLLPDLAGPNRTFHFSSVSDNATVFLNGKKLLYHEHWTHPFEADLDSAWKVGGPNHLAVLVQNTWGKGYIGDSNLELPIPPLTTAGPQTPDFNDSQWSPARLPHDFVVEGAFDEKTQDPHHGYLTKGIGWYRKTFDLPASDNGKSLWVDFDGAFRDTRVWLNGRFLGRHKSGYTSFRHDISNTANYGGSNTLTVRVDARGSEGWWYEGGGIYRHVWLNKAESPHVAPWGVYVVSTPKRNKAQVVVQTTLTNPSGPKTKFKVVSEIQRPDGRTVLKLSSGGVIQAGGRKALTQRGRLTKPLLWSVENPHLYRLITRVVKNGVITDEVETSFGIRSIRFDAKKGFLLNGKVVKLKGTCNHQDHAGVGVAIPDSLFTFRVEKLKEMGSNAYRCAHNPPAPELLDACDRQGMLVIDENRRMGDSKEILSQVESMVLRDRNHPSIILWAICNEEARQGTEEGRKMGMAMKKTILKLDKTRPVTAAMNGGWGEGLSHAVDVQGFNYNLERYDPFRAKHPRMPVFLSETASTVSTRGIYITSREKGYVSAYDVNHTQWAHTAETAWKSMDGRPYMAGAFVWTGFDYKGEPTPYNWPCINSHFGILDMCGFPKDNFYYYQAWWSGKPVLHLFPHWNWKGREGTQIDVWCHTSYDQVELYLNGNAQGWKESSKNGHMEWKVWYEPGVLTAKAYNKGVFVAETKVETTGSPASIRLIPYRSQLAADGEDTIPVTVEILDDQGRLVPTADNEVIFQVQGQGEIAGVGNGDPSSHEPDKASKRKAFNGLCMALVRAKDRPGEIILTAESQGLPKAQVVLRASEKIFKKQN